MKNSLKLFCWGHTDLFAWVHFTVWWCVRFFHLHSSFIPHYVSRCCGVLAALHPLVSVSLCEENYGTPFHYSGEQENWFLYNCRQESSGVKKVRNPARVQRRGGTKEQVRECLISIFLKIVKVSRGAAPATDLQTDKYLVYEQNIAALQFLGWLFLEERLRSDLDLISCC